jgi:hypothetical protein
VSSLIGDALPVRILRPDRTCVDPYWLTGNVDDEPIYRLPVDLTSAYQGEDQGFVSTWWPRRSAIFGAQLDGVDEGLLGANLLTLPPLHSFQWVSGGANGRLGFVGVTRDAFGSPLGGCTVRCHRSSNGELVSQVTSNEFGAYTATSPYLEAHYLTVHKAGSPAVAGASLDTVQPA